MAKKKTAAKKKAAPQKKAVKKVAKKAAPKKAAKKAAPKKVAKKVAAKKVVKKVAPKKVAKKPRKHPQKVTPFASVNIPDTDTTISQLTIIPPAGGTGAGLLTMWNSKSYNTSGTISGQVATFDNVNTITISRNSALTETIVTANTINQYSGTSAAPAHAQVNTYTLSANNTTVYLTTVNGWLCWNTTTPSSLGNQICPITDVVYINQNSGSPYIAIGFVYADKIDIDLD